MKHIQRIYRSIFRWMPAAAIVTAADYTIGALVPAVVTVISINLFDSAARVLAGEAFQSSLYLYAVLYLGVYLVNDLMSFVRSITLNAGIYETCQVKSSPK